MNGNFSSGFSFITSAFSSSGDRNASDNFLDSEFGDEGEDGDGVTDCSSGFMYNVLMLVLFVFGTIGNVASVAVLRRPSLRRRPGSPALCVLVFVNTLGLFFNALSSVDDINSTYHSSLEAHIGPIGCKLLRFVPAVVQLMGHWVVVYITSQRFVAICLRRHDSSVFHDRNAKVVFTSLFLITAATQLWRPYLDTQEPATYENTTNGTMVLKSPAMCTAEELGLYIDIESFFYQLGLLFFVPAVLIAVMNACVIVKIYQDYFRNRRLQSYFDRSFKQIIRFRSTTPVVTNNANHHTSATVSNEANAFLEEMGESKTAPIETKLRKATIVLLAVTCTFLLYITPHLFLLLYVRLNELINGRRDGFNAFMRVCQALNVTSFFATVSSADYILIQLIFDDMFRLELKFIVYRLFGKCFLRCQYLYIRERQVHRSRLESRCLEINSETVTEGRLSAVGVACSTNLVKRRLFMAVPIASAAGIVAVTSSSAHRHRNSSNMNINSLNNLTLETVRNDSDIDDVDTALNNNYADNSNNYNRLSYNNNNNNNNNNNDNDNDYSSNYHQDNNCSYLLHECPSLINGSNSTNRLILSPSSASDCVIFKETAA